MLVNMKYLLDNANRDGYAVMAVNSVNMEMARAVIEAASEEHSPIIVQMGKGQMAKLANADDSLPMVIAMAERADVPICLNLDHGPDFETEVDAIHRGFTNVMIDASSLPYEENVRRTRMIVDLAHAQGISVEAELGHVGQAADGDGQTSDMYTNVEQAKDFVERTGIDALAVGVSMAFMRVDILLSAAVIGVVAFLMAMLGGLLGRRLGQLFQKRATLLGGVVLILIGLKILAEHLFLV